MQTTWAAWDRVTSDLNRLALAVPEHKRSPNSWEQAFLYLREDVERFLTAPDRQRARVLERFLRTSKTNYQKATGFLQSRTTPSVQMSSNAMRAMRVLGEDLDEYLNDRALRSFREESPKVLAAFNTVMPDAYSGALTATFVGVRPAHHAHFLLHETRQDFENHYNHNFRRPGTFPSSGVRAFCTPVYPNYPSVADLTTRSAPENRVIELPPDFESDSVAHELLHWATHQRYEDESSSYQDFANKVIIEGVTEYFSRVIHPSRRNYADELAVVQRVIAAGQVTDTALRSAYFGGVGVGPVLGALTAAAKEAAARAEVELLLAQMPHWRSQLARQKSKTSAAALSPGLKEFLERLSDAQIDTLAQGSGASPALVEDIKKFVAPRRRAP